MEAQLVNVGLYNRHACVDLTELKVYLVNNREFRLPPNKFIINYSASEDCLFCAI